MLKIISPGIEPDAAAMRAMFAARKSVFVDLLGWDVPVLDGRYEVDQFDNLHACYLVLTDDAGAHLASARLLPTVRDGILSGLFPMLCDGPPPAAPEIFEITRFCLDRKLRASERRMARDALVVALTDYALANGISAYCAVAETAWLGQILNFGWQCERLGAVCDVGGEHLAAVQIVIGPHTPALLADAGIRASGLPSVPSQIAA